MPIPPLPSLKLLFGRYGEGFSLILPAIPERIAP